MGAEVGEPSSFLSLTAAFSYGIASMAMVFVNKAVIMQYAHSMTLLTLQVTLSVVCTAAGVLIAALGDFSFDLYGYDDVSGSGGEIRG
ncbi:hypothetical protein PR202_gb17658 [Eleusine coracana subsp. coracana]|uniref:Uncharacterized protein n=1 Tax=Eleusine coracana subsp. coracana TaxID=191504 RepID=A0AAV5F2W5_ELECO|nr:hypothetical protein PR202_gb17658 [Eleusine coracana subsp. coracana]